MTDLLMRVLQNSVIASILFFVIQWLKPGLKKYRYSMYRMLWIVLILFLLIPFDITIPNFTHELKVETEAIQPLIEPVIKDEVTIIIHQENESYEGTLPQDALESSDSFFSDLFQTISLMDLVSLVVFSTGCVLFVFQLFTYFWFHRLLIISGQRIGGEEVPWIMSDLVDSPLLTGLIHPVIALPADVLDHPHLEVMIKHEMTHYQHKDLIVKFLMLMARCLHWFNPIVYLMEKQCAKDLEMACDEAVIQNVDDLQKQIYAQTLLDMVCKNRFSKAAFTTQFSSDDFKVRIQNVFDTHRNKVGRLLVVFSAGMLAGISVLFSVQLLSKEPKTLTVYQNNENQKSEYAILSGSSADELSEFLTSLSYTKETYEADKMWSVQIEGNTYEFALDEESLIVWKNSEEVFAGNTSLKSQISDILKMDELQKENEEQDHSVHYGSSEEEYFHRKHYLDMLNEVNQFGENHTASLSQYMVSLHSETTTVKYSYYDLLMEFYAQKEMSCSINGNPEKIHIVLSVPLKEGDEPRLDGTLRTVANTVSLAFDPDMQLLTGFEAVSALNIKESEGLKNQIIEMFTRSWNQAILQYQIFRTWHEEYNSVQHGFIGWTNVKDAQEIKLDQRECIAYEDTLIESDEKQEVNLYLQAEALTASLLETWTEEKTNSNEQILKEALSFVLWMDNDNHPYSDMVKRTASGKYVILGKDVEAYASTVHGLQWDAVELDGCTYDALRNRYEMEEVHATSLISITKMEISEKNGKMTAIFEFEDSEGKTRKGNMVYDIVCGEQLSLRLAESYIR